MRALVLAALVITGYGGALWWLLRRESAVTLLGILALCGLALSLRLVYTRDYPAGLNDDELSQVARAFDASERNQLFGPCVQGPCLLSILFQAPLVPFLGPDRWAIRTYSLVCAVLAVAAAFAVARALQLRLAGSLGVAALVAVLPWSIFYGRVSIGAEMVFHQLLLLAALGRLVWAAGGWAEVGMGAFGLALLLYDYAAGWSMVGMPVVAAVLARRGQRRLCLAIVPLALIAWLPYLIETSPDRIPGLHGVGVEPAMMAHPLATMFARTGAAFKMLALPTGGDFWLSIRAAGVHPWLVLALALVGSLTSLRRGTFLWAGLLAGFSPAVFGQSEQLSTHRMLMAFPFVALAAGCALDWPRSGTVRHVATLVAVLVIGVQSVRLYFSPAFWWVISRGVFDADTTALAEAFPVPPHPPFIFMVELAVQTGQPFGLRPNAEVLTVDNWFPANGPSTYAFTQRAALLLPFYENLFGPQRVRVFGHAFLVELNNKDWSWMKERGWAYEVRSSGQMWRGQVPTLFHLNMTFADVPFNHAASHVWRAQWLGPHATLRLRFAGAAAVEVPPGQVVAQSASVEGAEFTVDTGATILIRINGVSGAYATLVEETPAGERVPPWDSVRPVFQ